MAQPSVHGRFIWQELMTDDTAAAADFYTRVIGWGTQAPEHPNGDYRVFAAGKHQVGGAMSLPDHAREAGARPHWLPYIGADDVDAVVARVEQLGGRVLRAATDVQNVGRYAVLADPQGAAFGVYHPSHPAAATGSGRGGTPLGEFAWQELATSDFEAAFRFYSELFGWELRQRMDMGPAGTYLIFGLKGEGVGGIYKLSAQMPAPYWLSYITVANVDSAVEQATARGARVVTGPMDVPDGRIAQLLDASGVLFAIHARVSAAAGTAAATPRAAAAPGAAAPARNVAKNAAKKAAKKVVRAAAKKKAAAGARKVAKKAGGRKMAKKAAKKTAKKTTKKTTKKAAKRAGGRRAAGKTARKATRRVARTAAKTTARAKKKAGRARRGK